MNNVQFNTNKYVTKRVKFVQSGDTLKIGYAVCYNSDATTDMDGASVSAGTTNNQRFLQVEKPAAGNLKFFAGIVSSLGSLDGASGDWITIIEPTGSLVPVWTDQNCTNGATILSVQVGSYNLTGAKYTSSTSFSRPVGIAMDTIDRSSTNGLCLAWIDGVGINTAVGATSNQLTIAAGETTGTFIPYMFSIKSTQTGGDASAMRVRLEAAGAGMNFGMGALRCEGIVNAATGHTGSYDVDGCAVSAHLIFKTGNTPAASTNFAGLYAKVENQDSTPATVTNATVAAITCVTQMNTSAPATLAMLRFIDQGSSNPGFLFIADSAEAAVFTADTSMVPNWAGACTVKIAGTTYYLPILTNLS